MQTLKTALRYVLLAVLCAIGVSGFLLVRITTAVVAAVPGEIQATRAAPVFEILATRDDLTGQVQATGEDLLSRTDRQVAGLRGDVIGEVDEIRLAADQRVGDALGRVDTSSGP